MIEVIDGLADGVVGIEAVGDVTAEDYETVAMPAVERALATHDKVRLIHVLGERLTRHTAGALWDDARLGLAHARKFERIAVVTDLERFRAPLKAGAWAVPCEIRLFSNAERAAAETWISADLQHSP
jgi:SpoIIAA-like